MVQWLNNDQRVLPRCVVHGAALHEVVGNRLLGIAEGDTAIVAQTGHVAQLFAAEAARQRTDRIDARLVAEHFIAMVNQFDRR